MAQTSYSDILPNPSNGIAFDGGVNSNNAGFLAGPGYASVTVESKFKTMTNMTNSGVLVARSKAAQSFEVNIQYNPLTEREFNILYGFLMEKQGMLKSFFVPLPQHDLPQDSALAAISPEVVFSVGTATETSGYNAGVTTILIDAPGYDPADGQLRPGDMINFVDSNNSNHTKAYKITRVETNTDFIDSQPANTNELKISFVPPLQKEVSNNATVKYRNPTIKSTLASDSISYSLRNDNLYSFSLKVKEVQ